MIVRLNVVLLNRTVVHIDWRFDNLSVSHLQSQSELYHFSFNGFGYWPDCLIKLRCYRSSVKKKNYKKVKKTEPLDWKKAKDKYFLKKLDNNKNNDDGLLTDPLGGSSLLKYINYN